MQHWYSYHSEKTMGHTYASAGGLSMYLTQASKKLESGDIIWVVEGNNNSPKLFFLVDCFKYVDAELPPFAPSYSRFAIRILGRHSLLRHPILLNHADKWFSDLHGRFITKQKFFHRLEKEPELVEGLCTASGIRF